MWSSSKHSRKNHKKDQEDQPATYTLIKRHNSNVNAPIRRVAALEKSEAQQMKMAARLKIVEAELAAHKAKEFGAGWWRGLIDNIEWRERNGSWDGS